ncbi:MAG: 7-carboxy-7-deazaguanine synthase QueE [Wenzhouxiangella sp.]
MTSRPIQHPADSAEASRAAERLRVTEIFTSIQGESGLVGWPTVFIRLTGCPLRCRWCDTQYAFQGGLWRTLDEILGTVAKSGCRHVCVTGGEPLAQKRCIPLLEALCDAGFTVSLETSGAVPVDRVDERVIKVVDFKAPGSGEVERNLWDIVDHLQPHDQIKFVLADRADFDWALEQVKLRGLDRWMALFSPVWGELDPRLLADWLLAAGAAVRMQLQMHKYIWGDEPGR